MTWNDITIEVFDRIMEAAKPYKDGIEDTTKYAIDMLSAVTGKDQDYFLSMQIHSLMKEIKDISFIGQQPKPVLNDKIEVNGKKYNVSFDVKGVTAAQYIDYTETLKNDPENIAMMCAIFCVPDGHKYNEGYEVTKLAEEFYTSFKIADAMGISFFFTNLLRAYVKTTLTFLKKKLKRYKKKATPQEVETISKSITALQELGGIL